MLKSFTYRATNHDGDIVDGTMDASGKSFVAMKLQEFGLIPIRISASDEIEDDTGSGLLGIVFSKVSKKEVLNFTKEIASMLRSGIEIDRGLKILIENMAAEKEFTTVLREVLKDVEGGATLADALIVHQGVFSKLYVKMVASGEASGSLETIFTRLTELLERGEETRGEIKSALVYPAFLTFVSGASVVVLLAFVIPRFASTFSDIGVDLPVATQFLLGLSQVVVHYWWLIVLSIAMALIGCRYYINTPSGAYVMDDLLLRLPLIGGLIQRIEVSRFSRTLGTILNGGLPILESLAIVGDIAENKVIAYSLDELYTKVKRGESIGRSLKGNNYIPSIVVEMIIVGEETGRLPDILIEIADRLDHEVSEQTKRLLSLLEPALSSLSVFESERVPFTVMPIRD